MWFLFMLGRLSLCGYVYPKKVNTRKGMWGACWFYMKACKDVWLAEQPTVYVFILCLEVIG